MPIAGIAQSEPAENLAPRGALLSARFRFRAIFGEAAFAGY
jgi:hypothetical protein